MPVSLTSALLDQILFAMEDQDHLSVVDLSTLTVVPCDDENSCPDGPVLPLPSWTGVDGFRVMREFSDSLNHPEVQAELRKILDSGVGVFKRFKQVLKPRESLFRLWAKFKRRAMEDRVRQWLEQWPDTLSEDPDHPALGASRSDLLRSDFSIRTGTSEERSALRQQIDRVIDEISTTLFGTDRPLGWSEYWRSRTRDVDHFWVAEALDGSWAGIVGGWLWRSFDPDMTIFTVSVWSVDPVYRGLGLGLELIKQVCDSFPSNADVVLDFPVPVSPEGALSKLGFRPRGVVSVWGSSGSDQRNTKDKPAS